ncbi:MAG: AI-2E family transporter [Acidimicrobiales bacterium]
MGGPVPWRTIWAVILAVVVALATRELLNDLTRVLTWLVVAVFFAIVLTPAVDFVQHKARLRRRGVATAVVLLLCAGAFAGLLYSFISPLVDQGQQFADDLPDYVDDARQGRGWVGDIVRRYDLEQWVEDNQGTLRDFAANLGTPALGVVRRVFTTVLAAVTILVLTVLLLLEGPNLTRGILTVLPERHRSRVRVVGGDCARAVSGYVFGNVVISVIAGLSTWIVLSILGVPYAGVLALWVAFADLIPLVGATLGAIPTIGLAFLHSVGAGIVAAIFFVAYQQFENHVLQVAVMSRTVRINPLGVLVSVLIGVELFGLLGALLAIPAAGAIQVVIRDLWDDRQGRLKAEPTVGAEEVPAPHAD